MYKYTAQILRGEQEEHLDAKSLACPVIERSRAKRGEMKFYGVLIQQRPPKMTLGISGGQLEK